MNTTEHRVDTIEKRIAKIEDALGEITLRNKKVESDKAWETSSFRRVAIAILTYITIVLFFTLASLPNPLINACIPMIGYVLSTLTLQVVRKLWGK